MYAPNERFFEPIDEDAPSMKTVTLLSTQQ
jgi:hypothetical protein